jgi:methylmalonyl-CoA/ethylmalonyl-CoA epimerase
VAGSRIVLDHVAIGAARVTEAPAVLVGAFGGVPDSAAPSREFTWACWRFAGGGRVEVIEPRGDNGFVHRFLAQRGPGIHHVTFKVPNLREACDRAEAHGYTIVGYGESDPLWKEAFLHPKQALGIVVQLAESSGVSESGSGAGSAPQGRPPPGPENAPAAVTIVGLRLRARSSARARIQWERVLGGERVAETASDLIYRWPHSPLRIAVEIDPRSPEGPVCVEFASDRLVTVPVTQHAALGTVFRQCEHPASGPATIGARRGPRARARTRR